MQDYKDPSATSPRYQAWNKGKLIGAKPPLRPKHVWSIRTKLQVEGRIRELAMFNLAIDFNCEARHPAWKRLADDEQFFMPPRGT